MQRKQNGTRIRAYLGTGRELGADTNQYSSPLQWQSCPDQTMFEIHDWNQVGDLCKVEGIASDTAAGLYMYIIKEAYICIDIHVYTHAYC